ncbi:MAG: hypothetical protein U0T02_02790 [Solirubrobacteraceae bacterium]
MRALAILLAAGSLGLGAAFLAACGERSDLISSRDASGLNGALDAVDGAVGAGDCRAASRASLQLRDQVASLPLTVNARLRRNLSEGASTVSELAAQDCQATTTTTTAPPTTTETTPTTTTETTPTTTQTTPTTTETTTTSTDSTTTPPPTSPGGGGAPSGGASPGGGGAGSR